MVQEVSRREILTYAGVGAAGAGVIGVGSTLMSDNASATMQVEAEDLEVTTADGIVEEIIVDLSADCSYSNVQDVTFLGFETTLNGQVIHEIVGSVNAPYWIAHNEETGPESGDFTYHTGIEQNMLGTHLFSQTDFEPSDFEVPGDGESKTFDLNFEVEFRVLTGPEWDNTETIATSTASITTQLTIHNEADENSGGGGDSTPTPTPEPESSMSNTQLDIRVKLPNGETVSTA